MKIAKRSAFSSSSLVGPARVDVIFLLFLLADCWPLRNLAIGDDLSYLIWNSIDALLLFFLCFLFWANRERLSHRTHFGLHITQPWATCNIVPPPFVVRSSHQSPILDFVKLYYFIKFPKTCVVFMRLIKRQKHWQHVKSLKLFYWQPNKHL